MEDVNDQKGNKVDWEDVLDFLNAKRRLATKFEMSFGRRKQELDVSLQDNYSPSGKRAQTRRYYRLVPLKNRAKERRRRTFGR